MNEGRGSKKHEHTKRWEDDSGNEFEDIAKSEGHVCESSLFE